MRQVADQQIDEQPSVEGVLPPFPGDPREALLPVAALNRPLKVGFSLWNPSMPMPGAPERLWLYRNETELLAMREWTSPIDPDDLHVMLDITQWGHGEHRLHYRAMAFNGTYGKSMSLSVWIDRVAPVTGTRLSLPADLSPAGTLTARYLDDHEDRCSLTIELGSDVQAGDTLRLYWAQPQEAGEAPPIIELTLSGAVSQDALLEVPVPGALVRSTGDGLRSLYYDVVDRAGNPGGLSWPVSLTVAAQPQPRQLPPPSVVQASGSPPVQTLVVATALAGVAVEIEQGAELDPQEYLTLQWGEAGAAGAWQSLPQQVAQSRHFEVPSTAVAAHAGSSVRVTYSVFSGAGPVEQPQTPLALNVPLFNNLLPAPDIEQARGYPWLSLQAIPRTGAVFVLERWPLMSTDQRLRLAILGTLKTGAMVERILVQSLQVTADHFDLGVRFNVSKATFEQFLLNSNLTLRAYVSWNCGQTWPASGRPNFPARQIQLLA